MGRLAIAGTCHNEFVKRFDIPAAAHELGCQPVEKLGVAGPFALGAKLVNRLHEASSEERLPIAIDGDSGSKRVVRLDKPAREGEAIVLTPARRGADTWRHAGRHLFARPVVG